MSQIIAVPPARSSRTFRSRVKLSRRVIDRVFGFDFFISYAWSDGAEYAKQLCSELRERGYEVFLDRSNYEMGDEWMEVGAWTLRRTSRLVLVGTPEAIVSRSVLRELAAFSETKRRIVPIDFGGSLANLPDSSPASRFLSPSVLRIQESPDRLNEGPSGDALAALTRTFDIASQNQKRFRALLALAGVFAVLAVAATVFGVQAEVQRRLAIGRYLASEARLIANTPQTDARTRDLLAAVVVEALRRLTGPDARSLAAEMAVPLSQRILVGGNSDALKFVPGRDQLASTGFGLGLKFIEPSGTTLTVSASQLGATDKGAPTSSLGRASRDGQYIVVETSSGSYLVNTRSLVVRTLPRANEWSTVFSSDNRRLAYVIQGVTATDGDQLAVMDLGDSSVANQVVRTYALVGVVTQIAYADGPYVLFDEGHITRVDDSGKIAVFETPSSLRIASLVSDGRSAFLVAESNFAPPAPPIADFPDFPVPTPSSESHIEPRAGSTTKPILQGKASPGLYRLDLQRGTMDAISTVENPIFLQFDSSANVLFVLCENGFAILNTATGAVQFHPGKITPQDLEGSVYDTALVFNGRSVVAKDSGGWREVDRQTGADWFVAQRAPKSALLADASSVALFIGDYDWLIADLANQTILAQFTGGVDPEKVAIDASGTFLGFADAETVGFARLHPDQLATTLCRQPGHNLTAGQSKLYLPSLPPRPTCEGWAPSVK